MGKVKRDNTPEQMRRWLDSVPLVTEPPTSDALFEARTIIGVELLHAYENDDPMLADNLRKAYALLAGVQAPQQLPAPPRAPEDEAFAFATERPGCWNCGGTGVRCCEFGADR